MTKLQIRKLVREQRSDNGSVSMETQTIAWRCLARQTVSRAVIAALDTSFLKATEMLTRKHPENIHCRFRLFNEVDRRDPGAVCHILVRQRHERNRKHRSNARSLDNQLQTMTHMPVSDPSAFTNESRHGRQQAAQTRGASLGRNVYSVIHKHF